MEISQVCAYANWPDESLEVWKWCERNRSTKNIVREMKSLFLIIYAEEVAEKGVSELLKASRTIGMTDLTVQVANDTVKDILRTVFFAHYGGRCLDKERLQYFAPDEILTQGTRILDGNKLIIASSTSPGRKDLGENAKLPLPTRKGLGNALEQNRLLATLGKQWNYLFDWKVDFRVEL